VLHAINHINIKGEEFCEKQAHFSINLEPFCIQLTFRSHSLDGLSVLFRRVHSQTLYYRITVYTSESVGYNSYNSARPADLV